MQQQLPNYYRVPICMVSTGRNPSSHTCEDCHWKTPYIAGSFTGYAVSYALSVLQNVQGVDYLGPPNCIQSLAVLYIEPVSLHSQILL